MNTANENSSPTSTTNAALNVTTQLHPITNGMTSGSGSVSGPQIGTSSKPTTEAPKVVGKFYQPGTVRLALDLNELELRDIRARLNDIVR